MLISFSIDHRRMAAPERGRYALSPEDQLILLGRVALNRGQALILCTCNRAELVAWVPDKRDQGAVQLVGRTVRQLLPELGPDFLEAAQIRAGNEAARHLLRVAAGLESQIPGDSQIMGQVRDAYLRAQRAGTVSQQLHRLLQTALRTGKRVRHETVLGRRGAGIGHSAARVARAWLSDQHRDHRPRVVLLGAGKAAESALASLVDEVDVTILNRTTARAIELAQRLGAQSGEYGERYRLIAHAEVTIVTTAAPEPVVRAGALREARAGRETSPLLLVDLSMPANVDPAVNELAGVSLLTLDQLGGDRPDERARVAAATIVEQEMAGLMRWFTGRERGTARVA